MFEKSGVAKWCVVVWSEEVLEDVSGGGHLVGAGAGYEVLGVTVKVARCSEKAVRLQ